MNYKTGKVLALIPARGGSKGIPRKNIRNLNGKPLIGWTIETAKRCKYIDRIVVSTDDEEIADVSASLGAEVPFIRPNHLARDETPGIDPVIHALNFFPEVDDLLLLQPTSPLRTVIDINNIFEIRSKYDAQSAVSVVKSRPLEWMYRLSDDKQLIPLIVDQSKGHNRQSLPSSYILNGALYLATREFILNNKTLTNTETVAYEMPVNRSIDIDTLLDWDFAEYLISLKR